MALNPIIPREQRQKRGALENAALAMGLANSVANIADTSKGLYDKVTKPPIDMGKDLATDPNMVSYLGMRKKLKGER